MDKVQATAPRGSGLAHLDRGPSQFLIQLGREDGGCGDLILGRLGALPGKGSEPQHRGLRSPGPEKPTEPHAAGLEPRWREEGLSGKPAPGAPPTLPALG